MIEKSIFYSFELGEVAESRCSSLIGHKRTLQQFNLPHCDRLKSYALSTGAYWAPWDALIQWRKHPLLCRCTSANWFRIISASTQRGMFSDSSSSLFRSDLWLQIQLSITLVRCVCYHLQNYKIKDHVSINQNSAFWLTSIQTGFYCHVLKNSMADRPVHHWTLLSKAAH